jgi:hypothetical protein
MIYQEKLHKMEMMLKVDIGSFILNRGSKSFLKKKSR